MCARSSPEIIWSIELILLAIFDRIKFTFHTFTNTFIFGSYEF